MNLTVVYFFRASTPVKDVVNSEFVVPLYHLLQDSNFGVEHRRIRVLDGHSNPVLAGKVILLLSKTFLILAEVAKSSEKLEKVRTHFLHIGDREFVKTWWKYEGWLSFTVAANPDKGGNPTVTILMDYGKLCGMKRHLRKKTSRGSAQNE
jgi:hypothetical protein